MIHFDALKHLPPLYKTGHQSDDVLVHIDAARAIPRQSCVLGPLLRFPNSSHPGYMCRPVRPRPLYVLGSLEKALWTL